MILTEIMAKSKNRRKNGKAKKHKAKLITTPRLENMDIQTQIKTLFPKTPKCKYCETECSLAPDEDVKAYKEYDTSYRFDFIYVPECKCWEKNDDWMI